MILDILEIRTWFLLENVLKHVKQQIFTEILQQTEHVKLHVHLMPLIKHIRIRQHGVVNQSVQTILKFDMLMIFLKAVS